MVINAYCKPHFERVVMEEIIISSLSFKVAGILGFGLGVLQLLPCMQSRAAKRNLRHSIYIPLTFVAIGFVSFMIGVLAF